MSGGQVGVGVLGRRVAYGVGRAIFWPPPGPPNVLISGAEVEVLVLCCMMGEVRVRVEVELRRVRVDEAQLGTLPPGLFPTTHVHAVNFKFILTGFRRLKDAVSAH